VDPALVTDAAPAGRYRRVRVGRNARVSLLRYQGSFSGVDSLLGCLLFGHGSFEPFPCGSPRVDCCVVLLA
jgi:hypothetical protein